MAKASILDLNTTQTFQNWFDKTNELVNLMREEVLTASIGQGDETTGNATLIGNFSANNISISDTLTIDIIESFNNDVIGFDNPISILGTESPICATYTFNASGGRTRYSDGTTSWDIGMEESTDANFIINTGIGSNKFQLSPDGTLTIQNIIITESIGGEGFNLDITTDDVVEGANNVYYTSDRVDAAINGTVNKNFIDDLNINAVQLGGQTASSYLRNNQNGTLTGNLSVTGALNVGGDITTGFDFSDIRLKKNILKIENSLDKINTLSGYTFEYKNKPGSLSTGLIAQELEKVLPEAVYEVENTNGEIYKAIRYGNVVSLLVESIKELSDKVKKLENK
jgi:hypothetical protein